MLHVLIVLITGNKELLPKKVKLEIFDISEKDKGSKFN